MLEITSFDEVHELLESYVPPARSMRGAYTLERMTELMAALGNPQNSYKVIHIAGTSGKTSTAYYVAALLQQSGKKIGLTVSPHIDQINERVQLNLQPLNEQFYCEEMSVFYNLVKVLPIKPTYFEILVAFAYWEFARQNVDYAVVEVGLGGLLDGTNVISRDDKICAITDIGLDHTDVLGNTISKISAQKAGIIKPHNTVFIYQQGEEVMQVVQEVCRQQQAVLHEIQPLNSSRLPRKLALFQRRNWYLALKINQYIAKRDGLTKISQSQIVSAASIVVPVRMEIIEVADKTVILDGAHNSQKMQALAKSIKSMYGKQSIAVLLSIVQSNNFKIRTSLKPILKLADHVIITSFETQQDMRKKSVDPLKIAEYCVDLGFEQITIIANAQQAYKSLLERPEPVLLITGSFYLLNHVRPLVQQTTVVRVAAIDKYQNRL